MLMHDIQLETYINVSKLLLLQLEATEHDVVIFALAYSYLSVHEPRNIFSEKCFTFFRVIMLFLCLIIRQKQIQQLLHCCLKKPTRGLVKT